MKFNYVTSERRMRSSHFPRKFWGLTPDKWEGAMPFIDISDNSGYYFYGGTGSGKTMFACICGMRIFAERPRVDGRSNGLREPKDISCQFVSAPELLLKIQATFNTSQSVEDILSDYADVDYLILDDLGAEKSTEWAIQMLYLLIDRRERAGNNRIIVTSNLSLDEIAERLSDRIASRIGGMCKIIKFSAKDYRLK